MTPPRLPSEPPVRRGRREIQPAPRAGRAASEVVSKFTKRFGSNVGELANRWNEIVGEKTARMCTPVKLTGRGSDGILHLAAIGPAALLVEADSANILQKVNTFFGRDVARRIALTRASARTKAAPVAERPRPRGVAPTVRLKLEAELAEIEDPRLKAALMKLGQAALGGPPASTTNKGG
jgi:hypothetical protein